MNYGAGVGCFVEYAMLCVTQRIYYEEVQKREPALHHHHCRSSLPPVLKASWYNKN
jgi:hypothetical protein